MVLYSRRFWRLLKWLLAISVILCCVWSLIPESIYKSSFLYNSIKASHLSDNRSIHEPPTILDIPSATILTCQHINMSKFNNYIISRFVFKPLTPQRCSQYCIKQYSDFMALTKGDTCLCTNIHGIDNLVKLSQCNLPCTGDQLYSCGGKKAAIFYKLGDKNGAKFWSIWTSFTVAERGPIARSRYRGCPRTMEDNTACTALITTETKGSSVPAIVRYFIGCFTPISFQPGEGKDYIVTYLQKIRKVNECIESCNRLSSVYAILLLDKGCVCADSLGWAQPADICTKNMGAAVFSTHEIKQNHVKLLFQKRRTTSKVAVVSHYRGGSTIVSALFSLLPESLYAYEPGSVYGVSWPNLTYFGDDKERNSIFLQKVYPAWFDCKTRDLPGNFLARYPSWGSPHNQGMENYNACKQQTQNIELCIPLLTEQCWMSPIVAAKTTRILQANALEQIIASRPDIKFIHAFRDPRAVLESRARLLTWYQNNQVERIHENCIELNNLYNIFERDRKHTNTLVVHYEDIANNLTQAALVLYSKLNISTAEATSKELLHRLSGHDKSATRRDSYDIIVKNPGSRLTSWITKLSPEMLRVIEKTGPCSRLFHIYSSYYKPIDQLLSKKNHTKL